MESLRRSGVLQLVLLPVVMGVGCQSFEYAVPKEEPHGAVNAEAPAEIRTNDGAAGRGLYTNQGDILLAPGPHRLGVGFHAGGGPVPEYESPGAIVLVVNVVEGMRQYVGAEIDWGTKTFRAILGRQEAITGYRDQFRRP